MPEPQTALTFHGYQIQDGGLYENVHSSAQNIPAQLANHLPFLNMISKCFKGIDVHDKKTNLFKCSRISDTVMLTVDTLQHNIAV